MTHETPSPLIVGFVADLMFTTRIEIVVRQLGYRVQWIASSDQLAATAATPAPVLAESPGERLYGRDGQLFDYLTSLQPALLLFDLNNTAVPWRTWIAALKSSPATRRLPILCFGAHEEVTAINDARHAGADAVVGRSRFTSAMAELFTQYARIPDPHTLAHTCQQPLSHLARQGILLFNQGEYYRCHDDLEAAWRADPTPGRDLYQGILQIGIALYQIQRGNYRGAVKMLLRARQWLDPLPPTCRGLPIAQIRANAQAIYQELTTLGPARLTEFNWALIQPVPLPASSHP